MLVESILASLGWTLNHSFTQVSRTRSSFLHQVINLESMNDAIYVSVSLFQFPISSLTWWSPCAVQQISLFCFIQYWDTCIYSNWPIGHCGSYLENFPKEMKLPALGTCGSPTLLPKFETWEHEVQLHVYICLVNIITMSKTLIFKTPWHLAENKCEIQVTC